MLSLFERLKFLSFYYFSNFLFVRLPRFFNLSNPDKFRMTWEHLKKDLHKKDCGEFLIIGNGPSLNIEDLESLSSLTSIASNKIFLFFEQSNWRPTFLTICDTLLSYKLRFSDFGGSSHILCSSDTYYLLSKLKERRVPWRSISLDSAWKRYVEEGNFSPDPIENGFYEGFSITNQNIQLAIWLGARKIYLIGVDHFYDEEKHITAGSKLTHLHQNHFSPNYRTPGEIVNNAPVAKMEDAYEKTRRIAESHGVEVINISRKTGLKIFSKMKIEELIGNKNKCGSEI